VKKVWRQEVAIFVQTATNFGKERLWCSKIPICPQISPKWKIISAKTARIQPKLRSMAKIARLRKNTKVAQKLNSATSQFSGGTNKRTILRTNFVVDMPFHVIRVDS